MTVAGELQETVDEALQTHGVPGASVAVFAEGELACAQAGVLNIETGIPVTSDTLFQVGSIAKAYTATAIMRLAERGELDLDAPLSHYLPELILADGPPADDVTVRRLLSHTSGLDGDYFLDTGEGNDCLARYVFACADLPMIARPGDYISYSNAGYVLLGRLIERLTGAPWEDAMRSLVLDPLGADHTLLYPEDTPRFCAAIGHFSRGGALKVAETAFMDRSGGPAGARMMASATDLIAFARMHLEGGAALLRPDSAAAMQEAQAPFPYYDFASHWGLGWMLFDYGGERLVGHDGSAMGQCATLRFSPRHNIAIAAATNSEDGKPFLKSVCASVLQSVARIAASDSAMPDESDLAPADPENYAGRYRNIGATLDVNATPSGLRATHVMDGFSRALFDVFEYDFTPAGEHRFRDAAQSTDLVFLSPDGAGRPRYAHAGGRLFKRGA